GQFAVMAAKNGSAILWDVSAGKRLAEVQPATGPLTAVALSPDGGYFAIGTANGDVTVENAHDIEEQGFYLRHDGKIVALVFSSDGGLLATAGSNGMVKLWDILRLSQVDRAYRHGRGLCTVAFSPDKKLLATRGIDGTLQLWQVPR